MSKAIKLGNFRVEVEPRSPGDFGMFSISGQRRTEKEERDACEEIAEQIRRHVDGLPTRGARGVSVICDTEYVCEFCGARWTEDKDSPHNGGCCDADAANMPAEEVIA